MKVSTAIVQSLEWLIKTPDYPDDDPGYAPVHGMCVILAWAMYDKVIDADTRSRSVSVIKSAMYEHVVPRSRIQASWLVDHLIELLAPSQDSKDAEKDWWNFYVWLVWDLKKAGN